MDDQLYGRNNAGSEIMGLAGGSAANLKMSLEKYCKDSLDTTEGLNVDFEGLAFDDTSVDDWVQLRIIDTISEFHRQASATKYGETANVLFQISIFVKKGYTNTSDRVYRMRDIVAKYFKVGEDIDLKDYINDGATLNKLRVRDFRDQPLPETNELFHHICQVEVDYTRLTGNP
ncbi:MAG TPA: hypothetical protein ENH60_10310 [Pricia sp.]|nr:hypothetical protein [Pricia sp.]